MTIKETYIFLGQVKTLSRREQKLKLRIDELRFGLLPSAIRYDTDRVQSSPKDRMLETYADIDELWTELSDIQHDIKDAKVAIINTIYRLPEKERYVLKTFYVDMWTIRSIAHELLITERHVFRLRANGVSMLCEVLNERARKKSNSEENGEHVSEES